MSKHPCSYHDSRPSVWRCTECNRDYCSDCVVPVAERAGPTPLPICTLCNNSLNYLGAGNEAKPFWSMSHVFFAFPFKVNGLIAIGFFAFIGLFFGLGLFGIVAVIFTIAVILKYGLKILESVADGQLEPPSINRALEKDEDNLFLRFMAILFILGVATGAISILVGEVAGTIFTVMISLLTPAMFVFLALDRQISSALDPIKLIGLAVTIGPPYLLVVLLSNVISTGPVIVFAVLGEGVLNSIYAGPVTVAVLGYFAIVYFALLGYVLYENQAELGYVAGDPEDQTVADTLENRRRKIFGEANLLMQEKRIGDGFTKLTQADVELKADAVFAERYFNLALERRETNALTAAANLYIGQLYNKQAYDFALDIWRKARDVDTKYMPAEAAWRHRLAEAAIQRNLHREAFLLLVNLHKLHGDYQELPEAYHLLAQLLEQQNKAGDAKRIYAYLEQRKRSNVQPTPAASGSKEATPNTPVGKDSSSDQWTLLD